MAGGSVDRGDQFAGLQHGFDFRRVRRAGDADRSTESSRLPLRPSTVTTASSAASATHISEGWVATQAGEAPRMACMRLKPSTASQPAPGSRLLQRAASS